MGLPHIYFKGAYLFQRCKHPFGADADTLIASYAGIRIDYLHMSMPQEINLTKNILRTSLNTLPASNAIARIDGNKRRCHTLLQL